MYVVIFLFICHTQMHISSCLNIYTQRQTHTHTLCTHTGWMKGEMGEDSGNIKLYVRNDGGFILGEL